MIKIINNSKKKPIRSKNWFKIWEKKGHNLKNSKIEKIIEADGFSSALGCHLFTSDAADDSLRDDLCVFLSFTLTVCRLDFPFFPSFIIIFIGSLIFPLLS